MEAMTSLSVGAVLEKMLGYERSCQQLSSNVPPVDSHDSQWFGVVFEIDEIDIVVSLNEVNSVLRPPYRITLVPKTKNWMLGLMNCDGVLIPVLDLNGFVTGINVTDHRMSRILVANHGDFKYGFLVSGFKGMRSVQAESYVSTFDAVDSISRYMDSIISWKNLDIPVVQLRRVIEDPEFVDVLAIE